LQDWSLALAFARAGASAKWFYFGGKMKVLIGVWHTGKIAKTETIREFAKLLIERHPFADICCSNGSVANTPPVPSSGDFQIILDINKMKIGIDSQTLSHNATAALEQFTNAHCDVIVCATLDGTASVTVEGFAIEHGYRVIWTSPYQICSKTNNQCPFAEMNKMKAKHLVHLLNNMDFPI
jgi:hypothetical protein